MNIGEDCGNDGDRDGVATTTIGKIITLLKQGAGVNLLELFQAFLDLVYRHEIPQMRPI